MMKTISFRVSDQTYERLSQLRSSNTWREFWMLCAIRHCQTVLAKPYGARRGREAYKRDIKQFQREVW